MKEDKEYEEFKEKTEITMKKDLKKIIKSYHKMPKTEYAVLKGLVETTLMKDVLQTVWITGFHEGTKQAIIEFKKGKKNKKE